MGTALIVVMEEKIKNLEEKLLVLEQLRKKAESFRLMNESIRRYMNRVEALDTRIRAIDAQIVNYDLVDLLSEETIDISSMNLETVVSVMKDILCAISQFKEDGSADYLERCSDLWKRVRKIGFLRLNEAIYRSTESLMMDPSFGEFVRLLDRNLVHRIQVKVLQSRKAECLRKSAYIRSNKEFLFRSMVQQELHMFLRLFPWESKEIYNRLMDFEEERPLVNSGLFECFSFSVLKEYFESCTLEELESLRSRLSADLKRKAPGISVEGEAGQDGEFYANVLVLVSVRHYLSSKQAHCAQDEVVEI